MLTLSQLVASDVVVMTTYGALSDEKVGNSWCSMKCAHCYVLLCVVVVWNQLTMATDSCHDANFDLTGGTRGLRYAVLLVVFDGCLLDGPVVKYGIPNTVVLEMPCRSTEP